MLRPRIILLMSTLAVMGSVVRGQSLVADLANTNGGLSSTPRGFVQFGGLAVFLANDAFGTEPWVTDGTDAGTFRLRDLNQGPTGSDPEEFTPVGSRVFFTALVSNIGRELFVSDGTSENTLMLADIRPGSPSSDIRDLTPFGNLLYFTADDGTNGREVWVSDGTRAGTRIAFELQIGSGDGGARDLVVWQGRLTFTGNDGSTGREIWVSDGTAANTHVLVDLVAGYASLEPSMLVPADTQLFFRAFQGSTGVELWVSDGTSVGTHLVKDIYPGSQSSSVSQMIAVGRRVFFSANSPASRAEPWSSDGTEAGTLMLADIRPGVLSSEPKLFTAHGAHGYFVAIDPLLGEVLWRSDGTQAGTEVVVDPEPTLTTDRVTDVVPAFGDLVISWFSHSLEHGLWRTNGTPGNATVLTSQPVGQGLGTLGGLLLFPAIEPVAGYELFGSDGTAAGTRFIADLRQGEDSSDPDLITALGDRVFFEANTGSGGFQPFMSDGTAMGTQALGDFGTSSSTSLSDLVVWQDELWMGGWVITSGRELLRTDGTPAGTRVALDLAPGTDSSDPRFLTPIGDLLFFRATLRQDTELSVLHAGSLSVTTIDLRPGVVGSSPWKLTALGQMCLFSADDGIHGRELWISDGTAAGTSMVSDLWAGSSSSDPDHFVAFGRHLYFSANAGSGRGLWRTDGTAAGTELVGDPARGILMPSQLTPAGDRLFFIAFGVGVGNELYVTDGTPAGTHLVVELVPGDVHAPAINDMIAIEDRLFFFANDPTLGRELWISDGTLSGTHPVVDVQPGPRVSVRVDTLIPLAATSAVIYAGSNGEDGLQLWMSDGTVAGTRQLGEIRTARGVGAASIDQLVLAGHQLFFVGDDGVSGREPWVFDFLNGSVPYALRYGDACHGTAGLRSSIRTHGLPVPGNTTFGVDLVDAFFARAAVLSFSGLPARIPIEECTLWILPPVAVMPGLVPDASGFGRTVLPIPADPALVGSRVFGQYALVDPQGGIGFALTLGPGLEIAVGSIP
ncbi:MAG: hypothetical protein H6834_14165 [Planctomycetes bacterium]|nr:hypothetical protein [Planctomycetota bacterium]